MYKEANERGKIILTVRVHPEVRKNLKILAATKDIQISEFIENLVAREYEKVFGKKEEN